VLSLEEHGAQAPQVLEADLAIARTGITSRQHSWRDELLKAGIRGKGGQMLKFAELEVLRAPPVCTPAATWTRGSAWSSALAQSTVRWSSVR